MDSKQEGGQWHRHCSMRRINFFATRPKISRWGLELGDRQNRRKDRPLSLQRLSKSIALAYPESLSLRAHRHTSFRWGRSTMFGKEVEIGGRMLYQQVKARRRWHNICLLKPIRSLSVYEPIAKQVLLGSSPNLRGNGGELGGRVWQIVFAQNQFVGNMTDRICEFVHSTSVAYLLARRNMTSVLWRHAPN